MNENSSRNIKNMPTIQPEIVIVGAGVAGIAAATKLVTNGFSNVTVLEAEGRIGGRLHSVSFGSAIVDLGAQWIHGEKENIVYEMVKDLDITSHTAKSADYKHFTFFTSDNSKLNKTLTDRLVKIADEIMDETTAAMKHGGSLGDFFRETYYDNVKNGFGSENDETIKVAKMIEEWACKLYLSLDAADTMNQIASSTLGTYEQCEGDHLVNWKNNGYSTFLDVLMTNNPSLSKEIFLKNNVLLAKKVNKIIWSQTNPQSNKVELRCTDGSTYLAYHIIVTVSVAVLKDIHQAVFEPSLPEYKVNCVENIPLGTSHKIFLRFPNKWWPNEVKDFSFLWTDDDKRHIANEFPGGPVHNGRSWLEDLFGFCTIDNDPNILLGWFVGPMTKEVECLPDETVQKASMFLLRKFVGKIYDVMEPISILRSKWGTNPNFLGTYSYVGMDMEERGATHEDLAKPLVVGGKEVVLFAGEATHSRFFSTVHGAVETGYREAERLIDIYKNSNYHKVVIVGAGLAGLGAATKLVENDIDDFVIVEAANQAGGRIKTIYIDNKPLDIGAQWMHGKSNPLYKLAKNNDLLSEEMSEEGLGQYVRSNGDIVDPYTVETVAFKLGQMLEECEELVNSDNYPSSLRVFLDEHFSKYLAERVHDIEQIEVIKELYDWHIRFQVIDNSCTDLSRLSAKAWGEYDCPDDEAHSNFKNGYQSLVKVILDSLPYECVKYNSEVAKISFKKSKQIELVVKDGSSIICDHLILTPSLGVLKEFDGLSEVLPQELLDNIDNMGFAGICKIYLFYDKKWWGESNGFQLLWNKECNFSEKHSWLRQITGFDEVFNHNAALMAWVGGDAVREVESLDTENIARQCTELLQKFLVNCSVPVPNKVIRTQWLSNPFIKGSYCHITPECDAPNSGIRTLGKPVIVDGVPRIILAGEAIHPSHYSTTHGAFESGLDQAKLISDYISGTYTIIV